ncbi:hypothetical protein [Shimia ponticola]|uniref:hypothetical protein n=1 Tax=Shimia ponticola TaxID=2582893 RepID=UPI0011BFAF1A|nr:hypothetical protein [Shimia ponticola]
MTPFRARVTGWSLAETHPATLMIDVETATPAIKASVDQIILRGSELHVRINTRDANPGGVSAQVLTTQKLAAPIPDEAIQNQYLVHIFVDGSPEKILNLS